MKFRTLAYGRSLESCRKPWAPGLGWFGLVVFLLVWWLVGLVWWLLVGLGVRWFGLLALCCRSVFRGIPAALGAADMFVLSGPICSPPSSLQRGGRLQGSRVLWWCGLCFVCFGLVGVLAVFLVVPGSLLTTGPLPFSGCTLPHLRSSVYRLSDCVLSLFSSCFMHGLMVLAVIAAGFSLCGQ